MRFSLSATEAATNKSSQANKIGKGGFGEVYKGILPNGQEVAVKRLSKGSQQGSQQEQKMSSWFERCKIIRGIAQGLSYLHEHSRFKIIHRDLKLSNILFDNNMKPKISDFGIAKMYANASDQNEESTSKIVGTHDYMAPEYVIYGKFLEKSDIFSFGVIILEIISGRRNGSSNKPHLLSHAWKQWQNGTQLEILDPCLMRGSYSENESIKCLQIGLLCVQADPNDRLTMSNLVFYLSNLWIELQNPREPAFFTPGSGIREVFYE
ncbi:cysteine-rich receptor-like protein kinase 8 [Neltuma alba]|uniref:cysteine-rich receptor-like protein kinase 8 n=1 Tax=Neltuma alba TaxID=207710 RepID=UPI0010A456CA|nr:cysteine-rich receptor-like protein kinase 8 [Prosopis alba]